MKATQMLHDLGQSLWARQYHARPAEQRHAQALHRRTVGDGAHLELHDLRARHQEQPCLRCDDPQEGQAGQVGGGAVLRARAGGPHPGRRPVSTGKRAGVVINPATPAAVLEEILQDLDQVLVMTVNPGFGHQHFLHATLPKIRRVRQMIEHIKPGCELEVDGGIDAATAPLTVVTGANVLVAGTAIFGESEEVAAAMDRQRDSIKQLWKQPQRVE